MADINQIGQTALAGAPSPLRRLLSGINPQFSLENRQTQGIGTQPKGGKEFAGVEPGSTKQILVTDPARFMQSPRQAAAHEATHIIQNNLSPQQQAQIAPDKGVDPTIALNPAYLAQQRAAGKSILQLPKEEQAYLVQNYTAQQEAAEKGYISPQQMQQVEQTYGPWIQDFNKAQLSNIQPTQPDSTMLGKLKTMIQPTMNTTPRAPMPPVNLQQDAVQFDPSQQGPITQSLLAGQNAPQQAPPQYVPPVVANTNKWAKVVQGALAGLGGGLSAGMQNVQDAGTSKGPHANGYQEGANAAQGLQQAQAQQQAQSQQQAQQNFENQNKTYQMTQEAQLNKARMAESHLNQLKLAQELDNAPKEAQDSYYKDQDSHAADLRKNGMSELAEVPDLNSLTQWMQQNKKNSTDVTFTHHRDESGKDKIMVWENPDHQVDAPTINKAMLAYNHPAVPSGTTMNYGDFRALQGKAMGAQADELAKSREQAQKDKAEMARTQVTQAGENARSKNAQAGSIDPALVDEVGTGKMAPERMSYMLAKNPQLLDAVAQKYPDFDSSKVSSYISTTKDFTSGKTSVALNAGGTALKHLNELKGLNTMESHVPGTPGYNAYENKADTVASELARFYGTDTVPGIASIKKSLTATLPGNRDAAIQTQAKSMGDKLDSFEQTWKNAAPSSAYEAKMPDIDAEAKNSRAKLDPDYAQRVGGVEEPVYHGGKLIGYTKDKKTLSRLAQ